MILIAIIKSKVKRAILVSFVVNFKTASYAIIQIMKITNSKANKNNIIIL